MAVRDTKPGAQEQTLMVEAGVLGTFLLTKRILAFTIYFVEELVELLQ